MNWPHAFSAGLIRLRNYAVRGFFHRSVRNYGAASDTAPITRQTPTPSLPPQSEPLLLRRAIRLCNREPKAIARYMQKHQNLGKGR